jgi:hypothetical protein
MPDIPVTVETTAPSVAATAVPPTWEPTGTDPFESENDDPTVEPTFAPGEEIIPTPEPTFKSWPTYAPTQAAVEPVEPIVAPIEETPAPTVADPYAGEGLEGGEEDFGDDAGIGKNTGESGEDTDYDDLMLEEPADNSTQLFYMGVTLLILIVLLSYCCRALGMCPGSGSSGSALGGSSGGVGYTPVNTSEEDTTYGSSRSAQNKSLELAKFERMAGLQPTGMSNPTSPTKSMSSSSGDRAPGSLKVNKIPGGISLPKDKKKYAP